MACAATKAPSPQRQRSRKRRPNRVCTPRFAPGQRPGHACGRAVRIYFALQTLEVGTHLGRALVAQIEILLERLVDDALQFQRKIRIYPDGWGDRLVQDRIEDRGRGVSKKGLDARRHFIHYRPKGEQVGTRVKFLAERLLGRHMATVPTALPGLVSR